ncbi:MAG: cyclase [Myxococcales bacterium]|nr:cyclase [Myxococcales bacterium]
MIRTISLICLMTCISWSVSAASQWEKASESDGLTIWSRDVGNDRVREIKVETVLDFPAERVWNVVRDVNNFSEFMPYVIEAKIIKKVDEKNWYQYQRLDPPLVDMRDYVLKVTTENKPPEATYYLRWAAEHEIGPKPREDAVRLKLCDGSWTLKALGPNRTHLTYWLYTDPGGSIPGWVARKANTVSLPDLIASVRNRSKDPKWKR